MLTVQQILDRKGNQVISIEEQATVRDAAAKMNQHRIGALVVLRGDKVVGIFTERDILTRVVAEGRDPAATPVGDVMTTPVACCQPDTRLAECRTVMTQKRIRHLPVVIGNRLVGIISSGDILAQETAEQQRTIQYLHEYLYQGTR